MSSTDIRDDKDNLKDLSPQKLGFIRNNWKYAKDGLDNTHRNYARTEHIYTNIPDADIDIRTLGQTVEILSNLGIIEIEFKTSNTVLYNMKSYEEQKFEPIIELFE